jgi:S-DNA-T family DNA segregation ATPase FtsK/SpoIIIE
MSEEFLLHIYYDDFFKEVDIASLSKNTVTLGKDGINDIVVPSSVIEGRHALIKAEGSDWVLYNESIGGISYNGKKISKKALSEGDVFLVSSPSKTSSVAAIIVKSKHPSDAILKEFDIKTKKCVKIGKAESNDIIYTDSMVSGEHARITIGTNGESYITDLKSSNGTYLNGKRIYESPLKKGDVINICGLKIVFNNDSLSVGGIGRGVRVRDIVQVESQKETAKPEYPYFQRSPRLMPEMPKGDVEIPNPPSLSSKPTISWISILLPPLLMAGTTVISGIFMKSTYMYISLVMTFGSLLVSILNYTSQVKKFNVNEKTRYQKYLDYIHGKRKELEFAREQQRNGSLLIHPDIQECINRAKNRDRRLWERSLQFSDFLAVRVGIGSTPFKIKIKIPDEKITIETDPLDLEPQKIANEFGSIHDTPVTLSLFQSGITGLIGLRSEVLKNIRALVMQIATHHSYEEVKIIAVYPPEEAAEWEWMRWLPHIWDDSRKSRFLAKEKEPTHQMLTMFYDIIKEREFKTGKSGSHINTIQLPHLVFILADIRLLENESIMAYLAHNSQHLGVSTLCLFDRMEFLPKDCQVIIDINSKTGEMIERTSETNVIEFTPDKVNVKDADVFARLLAPIRMKQLISSGNIPTRVTMLELLGVKEVAELKISSNWQENVPYKSLAAPIGIRTGGEKIYLDLHEKIHGPHGLVAGTTGSGKSELLQSLIISIAVNFHPHEVAFVLIDYKGGGMANSFIDLPHLVGTITNLGGNQTTRALVSIKSELKKRQAVFGEYGVNHIDSYQKLYRSGKAANPIPHLLIIADEFAELKSDQPEFMRELVSAARVGRSLGVHLILATQKPAGVVDEQIWSNSRFKLCLKVQDANDSQEVIKRPDAADIKLPGRAYIQVGNDEIFELFQSAWSGADYNPNESDNTDNTNEIFEVGLNGSRRKLYSSASVQKTRSQFTQLQVLVDHLKNVAEKNGIVRLEGPWPAPLPDQLLLEDVLGGTGEGWNGKTWVKAGNWLCPSIGLVDDPAGQAQYPLSIDLGKDGHLLVYGSPGYGKTTLLQTLVTSLAKTYTPNEVSIYIMDFGSMTLNMFSELPHCGGVVLMDEAEKLQKFIKFILREIDNRKKLFSNKGVSSLQTYREAASEELPAIVIIIDNFSALSELYPEVDETFVQITREGGNIGIHVVITASSINAIRYKISANCKLSLALQLSDKTDYSAVVGRTNGLEPTPVNGRGLIRGNPPLEFQTALPVQGTNELERTIAIKALCKAMNSAWDGPEAKPIPIMPDVLHMKDILVRNDVKRILASNIFAIPVGLSDEALEPVFIDLAATPQLLITGGIQSGKSNLLKVLAITMAMRLPPEKFGLYLIDSGSYGLYPLSQLPHTKAYISDGGQLDEFADSINALLDERKTEFNEARKSSSGIVSDKEFMLSKQLNLILVDDFNEFIQVDNFKTKELFDRILKKDRSLGVSLVVSGIAGDIYSSWEAFAKSLKDLQTGLLFGSAKDQEVFNIRLPYGTTEKQKNPGEGYHVSRGGFYGMKSVLLENAVLKSWVEQLTSKYNSTL